MWVDVSKESLGPSVILNEGYENFWSYIPHFIHAPFYVYAYAFGDCLVNSLYAQYQKSEDGFAERYLDLLRAGRVQTSFRTASTIWFGRKRPRFLVTWAFYDRRSN